MNISTRHLAILLTISPFFASNPNYGQEPRLRYGWLNGEKCYSIELTAKLSNSEKSITRGAFCVRTEDLPPTFREQVRLRLGKAGNGTGFIVRNDGIVVTCAHVVSGATKPFVVWKGKRYDAKIIDIDYLNDLALIKFDHDNLPVIPMNNSKTDPTGQEVYSLGFPETERLGESLKINRGIVSGTQRQQDTPTILLDMKINPGNSGGPLLNNNGQVIGVVSALWRLDNPIGVARPSYLVDALLKRNRLDITPPLPPGKPDKLDSSAIYKDCGDATVNVTIREAPPEDVNVLAIGGVYDFGRLDNSNEPGKIHRSKGFMLPPNESFILQSKQGVNYRDTLQADTALTIPSLIRMFVHRLPVVDASNESWSTVSGQKYYDYYRADKTSQGDEFYGPLVPPGSAISRGEKLDTVPINMECKTSFKRKHVTATSLTFEMQVRYTSGLRSGTAKPYLVIELDGEYVFDLTSQTPRSMKMTGRVHDNREVNERKVNLDLVVNEVSFNEAAKILVDVVPALKSQLQDSRLVFRTYEESWKEPDRSTSSDLPTPPAIPEVISDKVQSIHIKCLRGSSIEHQRDAAMGLINYRPNGKVSEVSSALVVALKNGDQYTAKYVVRALGVWADDNGIKALRELLKGEAWLRDDAIESLGKLRAVEATDELALLWLHKDSSRAYDSLRIMGSDIEERLHKYLVDTDPRIRKSIVKLLDEVGTSKSKMPLEAAMKRETDDTTAYAIDQLLYKLRKKAKSK